MRVQYESEKRFTVQRDALTITGENIAAGQSSVTQVMEGWLNSPGHCRNIMSSRYQEVGTSKVDSTTADYPTYWTQVFASPR
ncbi:CAP domain-containing protein [Alkalimarinus coralli]|uniref:CAP domain-containing protein n=1 Tax=Alkalimarinus coralli TaxID=2935863 RepID=UPI003510DA99